MDDPNAPPTGTADIAERMTSRLANSLVIAAGLVALGIYASGTEIETPRYQIVSTPDGRVVRVNTENGSIVSCDAARCTLVHLKGDDLDRAARRAREAAEQAAQPQIQPPAQQPQQQALPPPAAPSVGAAPQSPQPGAAPQPPAQPQR
jgi:hypothetical protein